MESSNATKNLYHFGRIRYFLGRLGDIVQPNYVPTDQDILQARVRTEQAYQTTFYPSEHDRNISLVLIDVGGSRELRYPIEKVTDADRHNKIL